MKQLAVVLWGVLSSASLSAQDCKHGKYAPTLSFDKFSGDTITWSTERSIGTFNQYKIRLAAGKTEAGGDIVAVFVWFNGNEWAFLGDRIQVLADTARLAFPAVGDRGSEVDGGRVYENRMYRVDPAQLEQVIAAARVEMRIPGDRRQTELEMTPDMRCSWQRFATAVLPRFKAAAVIPDQ